MSAEWFTFALPTGEVVKVDEADRALVEVGTWRRNGAGTRRELGETARSRRAYARGRIAARWGVRDVLLHRLVMGVVDDPSVQVDHINGDGLDNRRSNLRLCTRSQNRGNIGRLATNTSGRKGAYWYGSRRKWRALIRLSGVRRHLGYFSALDDAARAYDRAACAKWGEFVHGEADALNFSDEHTPGCCAADQAAAS